MKPTNPPTTPPPPTPATLKPPQPLNPRNPQTPTPEQVFSKGAKAIDDLKRMSKQLRSLPYVEPQLPTLALVGAPNVGKSSLVQVCAHAVGLGLGLGLGLGVGLGLG